MRRIVLAALLAAVAMPAWAFNETPRDDVATWLAAYTVCKQLGGNEHICGMHHASTQQATIMARDTLAFCEKYSKMHPESYKAQCDEATAYIKQRWGY